MMVVNLYADHLLVPEEGKRLRPAEEVWYATVEHPALFAHAAKIVGLSRAQFHEFQWALLAGKAVRVKLPHRLDAIVGDRNGHLYAVHDAAVGSRQGVWPTGYRVKLADGMRIYVPDGSGSLSVLRPHHHPPTSVGHRATAIVYVQPTAAPSFQPAIAITPVDPPKHVACDWWCFGLPLDRALDAVLQFGQRFGLK